MDGQEYQGIIVYVLVFPHLWNEIKTFHLKIKYFNILGSIHDNF